MQTLTERFDAVQDQILNLIEKGSTDIQDHVKYWDLIRKEGVLQYYARKHGLSNLGMQTLPSMLGAENKAKKAIQMQLILKSLAESPFGKEPWTVSETSIELYEQTDPERTFKKMGQTIEVFYDEDPDNTVAYTLWRYIYKQDENGRWHKLEGKLDYAGLYFVDVSGERVYYEEFCEDADRYGHTSQWTVRHNNMDISAPVTSSCTTATQGQGSEEEPTSKRRRTDSPDRTPHRGSTKGSHQEDTTPSSSRRQHSSPKPNSRSRSGDTPDTATYRGRRAWCESSPGNRRGRGREQGESPSGSSPGLSPILSGVSPEEVGGRHQTLPRRGLGRRERLLCEARDPPVLLLTGPANSLKCWRNRVKARPLKLFDKISTCFSWVNSGANHDQRLLIAFVDEAQRDLFLRTVQLPRGSLFFKGNLDGL